MESARAAVVASVAVVVALALATGPHVGLLPVPTGGFGGDVNTGTATVEVRSVPDRATLTPAEFADVYYLEVPDSTLAVSNVSGSPTLSVSLYVRDLGTSPGTVYALESGTGRYGIDREPLDARGIEDRSYRGRLVIVLRDAGGEAVVYDAPIEVEVVG